MPTELSGKPYTVHSRHPKMSLKQRYSDLTDRGSGELAGKSNVVFSGTMLVHVFFGKRLPGELSS